MLGIVEVEWRAEALVGQAAASRYPARARHTVESSVAKLTPPEEGPPSSATARCKSTRLRYTRDIPLGAVLARRPLGEIGEGSSEVQRIVIRRARCKKPTVMAPTRGPTDFTKLWGNDRIGAGFKKGSV